MSYYWAKDELSRKEEILNLVISLKRPALSWVELEGVIELASFPVVEVMSSCKD